MRTILLGVFAFAALVSSASVNEKYNDYQNAPSVYSLDGTKFRVSPRLSGREEKSNRNSNPGLVPIGNQGEYFVSRSSLDATDRKETKGIPNNIKQEMKKSYKNEYADIWDLYQSKNLDTWNRMLNGHQEKNEKFDFATRDQYRAIGRHGLGFERRTATANGLRAPLTLDQLQTVGKGEGITSCRCN